MIAQISGSINKPNLSPELVEGHTQVNYLGANYLWSIGQSTPALHYKFLKERKLSISIRAKKQILYAYEGLQPPRNQNSFANFLPHQLELCVMRFNLVLGE